MVHKHYLLMAEFAKDAANSNEPWLLWQYKLDPKSEWLLLTGMPGWDVTVEYRRRPNMTPELYALLVTRFVGDQRNNWTYTYGWSDSPTYFSKLEHFPVYSASLEISYVPK